MRLKQCSRYHAHFLMFLVLNLFSLLFSRCLLQVDTFVLEYSQCEVSVNKCEWVTVHRTLPASKHIFEPFMEGEGPRPLCGVRNTAKLGNWHPSTMDIIISRIVDSHPISKIS